MDGQICKMSEESRRIQVVVQGGENTAQSGGGHLFNVIYDTETMEPVSIHSARGKEILKNILGEYKRLRNFI